MAEFLPIVDVAPLVGGEGARLPVAAAIADACRQHGFFYIVGHRVDEALSRTLETECRSFFALSEEEKLAISMERGGRAWRGFFPVGAELTLGSPDQKEGLYFGAELGADDPRVRAAKPLHGANLFPARPLGLRSAVMDYIDALTGLGHSVMEGVAESLNLPADYFRVRYTADPLVLFRAFHYPPLSRETEGGPLWSVGEHTDYGLLTILRQTAPGLEVKVRGEWIAAPPIPESFVCNIGDMLDRMTGGHYRSTAHRVRNETRGSRFSFPFFFDPAFDSVVAPIDPARAAAPDAALRWDGVGVHEFEGTYGDYLLEKVGKVFPELRREVL